MMANPILAINFRGRRIENIHRGAFCVVNCHGDIEYSSGDIGKAVFPRSSIKAMQALALFKSGAVEKFSLDDSDIAIACSSHGGDKQHVEAVQVILDKIGCLVDDLECGEQVPTDRAARNEFFALKKPSSAIFNNCSGKHAGMLAVAKVLGVEAKGYSKASHAVQKLVKTCIEEVIGQKLSDKKCGIDGCSIPTYAAPLTAFALGFARMASGVDLSVETELESKVIFDAVVNNPYLIRGENTLDSDLMAAFAGRLMLKIGADGVFCGALLDKKIGFALKIDDGDIKAAEVAIANIILAIAEPSEKEKQVLLRYVSPELRNWSKIKTGELVASDELKAAFS